MNVRLARQRAREAESLAILYPLAGLSSSIRDADSRNLRVVLARYFDTVDAVST